MSHVSCARCTLYHTCLVLEMCRVVHMCLVSHVYMRKLHCTGESRPFNCNQTQNKQIYKHNISSVCCFIYFVCSCLILSPLSGGQLSEMTKWLWNEWNPQSPQVVAFKKTGNGEKYLVSVNV